MFGELGRIIIAGNSLFFWFGLLGFIAMVVTGYTGVKKMPIEKHKMWAGIAILLALLHFLIKMFP